MHNTVILTHGWTGSSVFSGLLGRAGAWLGEETVVKVDYDTFENASLVEVNKHLLRQLAEGVNHEHEFEDEHVRLIEARARQFDLSSLHAFMAQCERHRPWVWKDPRLTWTIRVWDGPLDASSTRFIVLTRDATQAWITANLRRHVQSFAFTRRYNDAITRSNVRFLEDRGLPYLRLSFEDLLLQPEKTLQRLGQHVDATLTMADLQAVCKLPLGQRSRGTMDFLKAAAIYTKNFAERDGRARMKVCTAPGVKQLPPLR